MISSQKMAKIRVFYAIFKNVDFFHDFPYIKLCFFQCITAIYHFYINMYNMFYTREMIQRQITSFIGLSLLRNAL